jgi:predicted Zn-dependent protease
VESVTLAKIPRPSGRGGSFLPNYYVYIATYPDLNHNVVELLSARISEEYGIETKIINIGRDESEIHIRDKQDEVYDEIINDVKLRNSNETINNFLRQIGLTKKALKTREGKRRFVFTLLDQSESGKNQWKEIELVQLQYNGNSLLKQLSEIFRNYSNDPKCLGILGITRKDIYENDYNFLFGWAKKKSGVISYARFLFDNPTSEQFEKRTIMQALSSIGFVIGIPRCTNPICARAYPNSLEEQDRKEDKLCDECKTNLRNLYSTLK